MAEIRAGVETFVLWGIESTFSTEAPTIDKHFGFLQTLTTNIRRNVLEYRAFKGADGGGRSPSAILPGRFDFTVTADFKPTNFDFLELVLGSVSGVGTSGDPFIYVAVASQPSFTISDNYDTTLDSSRKMLGCKINSATIRAVVGETASVTLDILGGDMSKSGSLTTNVNLPTVDPFNFTQGDVELPDSTPIDNIIDSFEVVITNNIELLHGVGNITAQNSLGKARDFKVNLTLKYFDDTFMDLMMGNASAVQEPSNIASITLKLDNGTQFVELKLTDLKFVNLDPGATITEVITEGMVMSAKNMTAEERIT